MADVLLALAALALQVALQLRAQLLVAPLVLRGRSGELHVTSTAAHHLQSTCQNCMEAAQVPEPAHPSVPVKQG